MKQCPHCQSMRTARIAYDSRYPDGMTLSAEPLGDLNAYDRYAIALNNEITLAASYCLDCEGHWDVAVGIKFYKDSEVTPHEHH